MSDNKPLDFENWYKTTHFWKMDNCMAKKIARDAWQAAIASVVIDLPTLYVDGVDAAEFFDDVKAAIEQAGVSYE